MIPIRINQKEEWSTSTKIKYQRTYKNITLQGVQVLDESIENFEEKIDVILMVGYDVLWIERSDQLTRWIGQLI